jgi:hypothetical protein
MKIFSSCFVRHTSLSHFLVLNPVFLAKLLPALSYLLDYLCNFCRGVAMKDLGTFLQEMRRVEGKVIKITIK